MKRDDGLTAIKFVILIVIVVAVIGTVIYFSVGDEGVITKATKDEDEFNKSEILDELNFIITDKYLATYKNEVVNDTKIEDVYNSEIVLNFLKEKGVIEDYTGEENKYYIKVDELKRNISQGKGENGSNKDVFIIEKTDNADEFAVVYIKNEEEKISIGNIEFIPEV